MVLFSRLSELSLLLMREVPLQADVGMSIVPGVEPAVE